MQISKIMVAMAGCIFCSSAQAQSDITSCIATQDDTARLACFDAVFPAAPDDGTDAAAWAVFYNTLSSLDDLLVIARPSAAGQSRDTIADEAAEAELAAAQAELAAAEEAAAAEAEAVAIAAAQAAADAEEADSSPTGTGKWNVRNDVSALTDDRNVFLTLRSENLVRGRFSGSGHGTLLIRCMENTTTAYLNFNEHHMADLQNYGRVEYRVDDAEMRSINMNESTDNRVLGLWSGGRSIPWIKNFVDADQLIVRATPFSESAITMTFDVRGLDEAISGVRETCSW